jgi:hypothetical protein
VEPYVFTQIVRDDGDFVPRWQQRIDIVQQTLAQHATSPDRPAQGKPRYYSFDHTPTLTKTPWEADRTKRNSQLLWTDRNQANPMDCLHKYSSSFHMRFTAVYWAIWKTRTRTDRRSMFLDGSVRYEQYALPARDGPRSESNTCIVICGYRPARLATREDGGSQWPDRRVD